MFRKFRRDERGAAMVEFALVSTLVFIPIVFGIVEFGRVVWAKNMVTAAAREGTRYAVVHGSTPGGTIADSASIATYVKGRTQLAPLTVRSAWSSATKDPGDTVTVTVEYSYSPLVTIPGLTAKLVKGRSKQVIWY